ncbi:hypothetical protein PPL_09328 [Heterostelium album PN500]|uniref:UspA domain-containing protein n=1 Tax=Heterostelium pallidum (strain ATCC 26659 / Pp 5 / PN500) TaxID=670386 RepID=D3BL96_HETP5|nr:hypothetical protein PPL_09328 [Heterostelium album PN500]EFA77830.1 hypothetical protein PPL_09328 [Heterostelium album PN500]|eukprot:XP_020429958.1 hypothetical protein PPL_09328 [Heterostelium album PN500]
MKYLIAIDGSDHAHNAFMKAVALYKPGDEIYTLIAIDLVHFMMAAPKLAEETTTLADMKEKMLANGNKLSGQYAELADEHNIAKYKTLLLEGNPRELIVKEVAERKIDILIIGQVGLINNPNISMGSTSTYCIRNCQCDVLLFWSDQTGYETKNATKFSEIE